MFARVAHGKYRERINGKMVTARRRRTLRRLAIKHGGVFSESQTKLYHAAASFRARRMVYISSGTSDRTSYDYTNPGAYIRKSERRHG